MIEHYIYLLAKSYFWVWTIFEILSLLASFTEENQESRKVRKLRKIKNGTYHLIPIKSIIILTLYWLAILIYFKI